MTTEVEQFQESLGELAILLDDILGLVPNATAAQLVEYVQQTAKSPVASLVLLRAVQSHVEEIKPKPKLPYRAGHTG